MKGIGTFGFVALSLDAWRLLGAATGSSTTANACHEGRSAGRAGTRTAHWSVSYSHSSPRKSKKRSSSISKTARGRFSKRPDTSLIHMMKDRSR